MKAMSRTHAHARTYAHARGLSGARAQASKSLQSLRPSANGWCPACAVGVARAWRVRARGARRTGAAVGIEDVRLLVEGEGNGEVLDGAL
eukprot:885165-Prymnesium_polylepis.1